MAFGGGEMERRVEAAEGGAAREPRVGLQQPPHLGAVAVPRGGRQALAEPGAPQGVAHMRRSLDQSSRRPAAASSFRAAAPPRRPAGY